eukprot:4162429-Pyramimonas_sp.AAC.1
MSPKRFTVVPECSKLVLGTEFWQLDDHTTCGAECFLVWLSQTEREAGGPAGMGLAPQTFFQFSLSGLETDCDEVGLSNDNIAPHILPTETSDIAFIAIAQYGTECSGTLIAIYF